MTQTKKQEAVNKLDTNTKVVSKKKTAKTKDLSSALRQNLLRRKQK